MDRVEKSVEVEENVLEPGEESKETRKQNREADG